MTDDTRETRSSEAQTVAQVQGALSRRNLIVLAGAGAVVAGCTKSGGGEKPKPRGASFDPNSGLEPNEAALKAATDEQTQKLKKAVDQQSEAFNPQYITLIRLSASKPWALEVNHASFKIEPPAKPEDRQAYREELARYLFNESVGNGRAGFKDVPNSKPSDTSHHHSIHVHTKHDSGAKDFNSFSKTNFGSSQQVEIYIWFDDKHDTIKLDPNWLISFSTHLDPTTVAQPNDSFFARVVADTTDSKLGGQLIAIKNLFTNWDGDNHNFTPRVPSDPSYKDVMYGLNIHYSVPTPNGDPIPMTIDPTTGNGNTWEP